MAGSTFFSSDIDLLLAPAIQPRVKGRLDDDLTRDRSVNVTAVIVSRNRPAELLKTLSAVKAQIGILNLEVIVTDSSMNSKVIVDIVNRFSAVSLISSSINLGGAGGFALGSLTAMARGADWLWLMDDDGRPSDVDVLCQLLKIAEEKNLQAVAPLVVDTDDHSRFAFPYAVKGRYVFQRCAIAPHEFLNSFAHLFNGLLIHSASVLKIGLPDVRMFARGDEVDFLHRMRRAGLKFGTTSEAVFLHPSSNKEIHAIWGGKLHVVIPVLKWRRRCQFRNRAFNFSRHKTWALLAVDAIRYPYYFLIHQHGDFAGFKEWLSCSWAGFCGRVGLDQDFPEDPQG